MSNHTPGPWSFSAIREYGEVRFYIAQAEGAPYTPHYSDVATLIAETVNDERKSIQKANACLIAAAPEMLDVLIEVLETGFNVADTPTRKRVRAVIAKATGEGL